MQLDKERLEKLAPQLSAQGIDPESLPQPGSDEWRSMIRDLSLRDPVLAQQTAGLVFDPNELTKSSLLDQQAKRSQARGGFGKLLSPLLKTTTANGDEVPNTTLTRNLVIGGVALAGLAFWFGIPHAQPIKSTTSTAAKPSGSGRPTSTGQPASTSSSSGGIAKPVSSGSAGVKDNTASPAVTSNSSDQTGFGSTDTQAAPSQNAVPTSAIMPTSPPSDSTGFQTPAPTSSPSRFALGGNGAPSKYSKISL